jgi:hypothetical protein
MFRWILMLRKLFSSSPRFQRLYRYVNLFKLWRERLKARRVRRARVQSCLEGLEERALPSASTADPSQMTEAAAQMSTLLEQKIQLIATVEQDLVNFRDALINNIVQGILYVEQQWDQLLGAPPPSSSGSGSGSGAMTTTLNTSNPSLQLATTQSGTGSGSGQGKLVLACPLLTIP